jgi:aspartyl-tRNA(Asn)/glutamyl-tRNA(Gln) amidotransferase subunit A
MNELSIAKASDLLRRKEISPVDLTNACLTRIEQLNPAGELWLRNTRPFNAYGIPTISVPCGFTRAGLPIGLQIAGPSLSEASLLAFARVVEQLYRQDATPRAVGPSGLDLN